MTSARELHSLVPETGGKTQTDLHRSDTFTRQTVTRHRTLGYLMGALLCALVVGCSAPTVRVPDTASLVGDTTNPTTSRQIETAKRAEGAAANAQADAIREDRAVAGFEATARLFNWAGSLLALASVGLFLASFFVPPTLIPRKLAFGCAVVGVGMLAGSYFLVRYGVATAWLLLAVFAVQAVVASWPLLEGWFRRKLEAKGAGLVRSENIADRVRGVAIAEAANPQARRVGRYRAFEPQVRVVGPKEAEVGA